MSAIRNRSGNTAFRLSSRIPAFFEDVRIFSFISEETFSENRDTFQRHEEIVWTEAIRKRPRRAPAMFSTPGDQKVNGHLIVKAPHSAVWRKNASIFVCVCPSIDVREDENLASRISPVHVDTNGQCMNV